MFKRILVATDGTTLSNHAVNAAAALAKGFGATLTLFHAIRTYKSPYFPDDAGFAWPTKTQYLKESSANADTVLTRASVAVRRFGTMMISKTFAHPQAVTALRPTWSK